MSAVCEDDKDAHFMDSDAYCDVAFMRYNNLLGVGVKIYDADVDEYDSKNFLEFRRYVEDDLKRQRLDVQGDFSMGCLGVGMYLTNNQIEYQSTSNIARF